MDDHPLLKLRQELGATQKDMADELGITRGRWSQLETGPIPGWIAAQIMDSWKAEAKRLGITLEKLVTHGR